MVTNTGIVKGFPSEDQYNEDMQSVIMSLDPYGQLSEFNDSTLFVLFREAGVDIRKYQALADKLSAYLTSDGVQLRITGVKVPDDLYDEFFASDDDEDYEFEDEDPEEELDFDFRDDFSDDPDDYPDVDEGYYEEDNLEDEGEDFDTSEVEEDAPDAQEVVEVEEEDIPDFEDDADEDF